MDNRRLLFVLVMLGGFIYVISPLALPLAMAAIFSALLYPLYTRLRARTWNRYLSSGIVTLALTFGFLLPTVALIMTGAKLGMEKMGSLEVLKGAPQAGGFFENLVDSLITRPSIQGTLDTIGQYIPIDTQDIANTIRSVARTAGVKLGVGLGNFLAHLPAFLLSVGVMVISIFFFLADADKLGAFVRKHSVFTVRQTDRLIDAFTSMSRSVLLASLASGFAQALIFWVACMVLGTNNATLIGFLVFFTSFIPLIGSAPVTLLIGLHEFFVVDSVKGFVLLVVAVLVAGVDNIVRPMVLRGAGNLHPLLAFVAAFGGLQVFGMAGLFLGPVIAGVFLTMVEALDP